MSTRFAPAAIWVAAACFTAGCHPGGEMKGDEPPHDAVAVPVDSATAARNATLEPGVLATVQAVPVQRWKGAGERPFEIALRSATPEAGHSRQFGTINLPIAKKMMRVGDREQERMAPADEDDAKKAITDYSVLDSAGPASFLALKPLTGRTHQLRVHCAAMGTPIVGDRKYGGPNAVIEGVPEGLQLFCREMTFPHPDNGRAITLTAPLTGRMKETWELFGFDAEAEIVWPDLSRKKSKR